MKITDIGRWRAELLLAEKFRDDEFGEYTKDKRSRAGENIDYFENGFSSGFYDTNEDTTTTLNLFHVIVKLIVPSLWFQNPQILALPEQKGSEDSAPYAKGIMNHYYKGIDVDTENELAIWDSYVLNRGVTKLGYATKFGMDINDPELEKKKSRGAVDKALERLGLKKGEKEEVVRPEINQKIVAEKPYVKWVSPFKFLMDPRARVIDEAMWVAEEFDKTVAELKRNKNYKNTRNLEGLEPDIPTDHGTKISETQIEEFKTVRVYEIHYRSNDKYYRLVLAKDGSVFKELYHEERIYEMDGFQYDVLELNRHGHLQFKRSDLMKIKNLQDRITSTIDSVLEQLDRFVPKIAVDSTGVTDNGMMELRDGDVGAIVECNKNPSEAIREIALTQYKNDLKAIIDEMINLITIMTGITKSKLLGMSEGETATGEAIAQGGENIRLQDMDKTIRKFAKKQAEKLWQVIKQFVPLEELEIITGEGGVDPETGQIKYSWLPDIDSNMSEKLQVGSYRFDIEVGSTQKVDTALITKRIENLMSILARTDVIALMQQQGKKVDVAEILKLWLQNNPEIVRDVGRIIQEVGPETKGLLPSQEILVGGQGGMTAGSETNAARAQEAQGPVNMGAVAQEARQV